MSTAGAMLAARSASAYATATTPVRALPAFAPRIAARRTDSTSARSAIPAKPILTSAAPAAPNAYAADSGSPSEPSPRAAVTGRSSRIASTIARSSSRATAPSAPAVGFFASMTSAPAASATNASAAFATLTSNRMWMAEYILSGPPD